MEEAMDKEMENGYWTHKILIDKRYVRGYRILPECTCSSCGYLANKEKSVCPRCGTPMTLPSKVEEPRDLETE